MPLPETALTERYKWTDANLKWTNGALRWKCENWLHDFACRLIFNRLIDFLEWILRHELVEWKAAVQMEFHEVRDERVRHAITLHDAANRKAAEHYSGHFRRLRRYGTESEAALRSERFDSLLVALHATGVIECIAHAARDNLSNLLGDTYARTSPHRVRCAELPRHRQPRFEHIHGDDRGAAANHRAHHGAEPHGTRAENSDCAARWRMQRIHDRARAGLHAAAEHAENFERRVFAHGNRIALPRDGIIRKRRLAEEVAVDRDAALCERAGFAGSAVREIQLRHELAIRRIVRETRGASAAG